VAIERSLPAIEGATMDIGDINTYCHGPVTAPDGAIIDGMLQERTLPPQCLYHEFQTVLGQVQNLERRHHWARHQRKRSAEELAAIAKRAASPSKDQSKGLPRRATLISIGDTSIVIASDEVVSVCGPAVIVGVDPDRAV
jgi:hypothetical protein